MSYHLGKRIKMNLFCGEDSREDKDKDDPAFIVSDMDDSIKLIYAKRIQIELSIRRQYGFTVDFHNIL